MKRIALVSCVFLFCVVFVSSAFAADEATIKTELTNVLGTKANWAPTVFSKLKLGMTCDEVKAVYPNLTDCDPTEEFSFASVVVENNPIVSEYGLTFETGKLAGGKLVFKGSLDKDVFKKVSLELFESKWGTVKADEKNADILTIIGPNYIKAQRNYMVTQWEIEFDFPKN